MAAQRSAARFHADLPGSHARVTSTHLSSGPGGPGQRTAAAWRRKKNYGEPDGDGHQSANTGRRVPASRRRATHKADG